MTTHTTCTTAITSSYKWCATYLIVLLLIGNLTLSCNDSTFKGREVVYPQTWPIPEIVVPPSSWQAPADTLGPNPEEPFYESESLWCIGFNTDMQPQQVFEHFDGILMEMGYLVHQKTDNTRMYISKDGMINVMINKSLLPKEAYKLEIKKVSRPANDAIERAKRMEKRE